MEYQTYAAWIKENAKKRGLTVWSKDSIEWFIGNAEYIHKMNIVGKKAEMPAPAVENKEYDEWRANLLREMFGQGVIEFVLILFVVGVCAGTTIYLYAQPLLAEVIKLVEMMK